MNLKEATAKINMLEQDNAELRHRIAVLTSRKAPRPALVEMIRLLDEAPRTVPELSALLNQESRLISQWLHQLKTKYNAEVITYSTGKKGILNIDIFYQWLYPPDPEAELNKEGESSSAT